MLKTNLPEELVTFQLEHASVIFTNEYSEATGKRMPKLYVQSLDQYHYQREFSVSLGYQPGDSNNLSWKWVMYKHPAFRQECVVTEAVAVRFINRFLHLCKEYPSLLFNKTGEHQTDIGRPRHEGFVRLSERLFCGERFSVDLLD